jgi:uncharacterized protein (TIGR04255 family)
MAEIDISNTPKFKKPPITETVLGVQFAPLRNFRITHFGDFHNRLGPEFSIVQHHQRLEHQVEERGPRALVLPSFVFGMPLPRVWYSSKEGPKGQHLVQLQEDRLILNWRKGSPGADDYASYKHNRQEFTRTLGLFNDFTTTLSLGEIQADQCEVAYVNRIPLDGFADLVEAQNQIFGFIPPTPATALSTGALESFGFSQSLWHDGIKGRLFVEVDVMFANDGRPDAMGLRITARGTPDGSSSEEILKWLDLGHYYVVKTFADITTDRMHKVWERTK